MRKASGLAFGTLLCALQAVAGPYNEAGPAVIQIHVHGLYKHPVGKKRKPDLDNKGTGFLVSPDGLVMSAGHLAPDPLLFLPGELYIEGRFPKPSQQTLVAQDPTVQLEVINAHMRPHDVALFKIKSANRSFPYLRLCDQYTPEERLLALGYNSGKPTLSREEGSVRTPAVDPEPLVMQMSLSPGDSGAPVLNQAGGVVGIAIGGATVNQQRIEDTSLAVMISNAIADLSPQTRALLGVSYDPDCSKTLAGATVAPTVLRVKYSSVGGLGAGEVKIVHSRFEPPNGFRFSKVVDLDAKPALSSVGEVEVQGDIQSSITKNGDAIDLAVLAKGVSEQAPSVAPEIWSRVEASLTPKSAPIVASNTLETEVRSFVISRALEAEGTGVARRDFADRIPAPDGFRFIAVVNVNVASISHSPSGGARATVVDNGSALAVNYSLESGPQWRSWIDAFVTAKMQPQSR